MPKLFFIGTLISVSLLLSGCFFPYPDQPLGDEIVISQPADWDGNWYSEDFYINLEAVTPSKGILILSFTDSSGDKPTLLERTSLLRRLGDWTIVNVLSEDGQMYQWGRIVKTGDTITVMQPDQAVLEGYVLGGKLLGRIEVVDDSGQPTFPKLRGVFLEQLGVEHKKLLLESELDLYTPQYSWTFVRR